jgi:hypothetical protein
MYRWFGGRISSADISPSSFLAVASIVLLVAFVHRFCWPTTKWVLD